jgi:hypothetical protein
MMNGGECQSLAEYLTVNKTMNCALVADNLEYQKLIVLEETKHVKY